MDISGSSTTKPSSPSRSTTCRTSMSTTGASTASDGFPVCAGIDLLHAGLSPAAIREIVRKRAKDIDAIAGKVSGHSLRVGSAQELARNGASIAELQQAGGWISKSMPGKYVRHETAARGPV